MKCFAIVLFFILLFTVMQSHVLSNKAIIVSSATIFLLFVLSDFFFEKKTWILKGLQLYMSIMLFIIGIFEMHHIVSSLCALSIIILPRIINELQ
nr:hypothetical protein [Metabacillus iocasae]